MHRKEDIPPGLPAGIDRFKQRVVEEFTALRDRICQACEEVEDQPGCGRHADLPPGRFKRTDWKRPAGEETEAEAGGGTMSVMRGRVFEKIGVNISEVCGVFPETLAREMPGADPRFWASGVSLVAHMHSPRVPAAHMNIRFIVTDRWWFGGGGDLTPVVPEPTDTEAFHAAYRKVCDAHGPDLYARYSQWCAEYFFLPHRNEERGVGGIFFDYRNTGDWEKDFAFTLETGHAYLDAHLPIVRQRMQETWSDEERAQQLRRRGRYAEFNLVYDRGTRFGLLTGGNPEAVLMSLPPLAAWP